MLEFYTYANERYFFEVFENCNVQYCSVYYEFVFIRSLNEGKEKLESTYRLFQRQSLNVTGR